jgi:hypothetical protein
MAARWTSPVSESLSTRTNNELKRI